MVWKAIADFQQCRRNNQCYPNPEKPLAKGVSWGHQGSCGLRRAAEQIHRLAEEKSWTANVWHGRISAPKNESKLQKNKNPGEWAFSITCLASLPGTVKKGNVHCTRLKGYRGNLYSSGRYGKITKWFTNSPAHFWKGQIRPRNPSSFYFTWQNFNAFLSKLGQL